MSSSAIVIGATGYIGHALTLAYRRAGFKVYAVVRNAEKAKDLVQNEIQLIIGDITNPESFKEELKHAAVIVDAVGDPDSTSKFLEKVCDIIKDRSTKPLFILTSGILVYGDNSHIVDESHPLLSTSLAKRIASEKSVISSKDVRGVVLRPGFVYGTSGGFFGPQLFGIKENDELVIIGRKEKRWSWVHVEDVADAFVRVAKVGHAVDGEVFDIAGPWAPTYEEFRVAAAKAAGWKGKVKHIPEVPADNFFLTIFEYNVVVNCQKAYNILGWRETHLGIVAEIGTYYASWKASAATTK